METKTKKTHQNEPQQHLVIAGGQVFDLTDARYRWLLAYDAQTRMYILSGLAKD